MLILSHRFGVAHKDMAVALARLFGMALVIAMSRGLVKAVGVSNYGTQVATSHHMQGSKDQEIRSYCFRSFFHLIS